MNTRSRKDDAFYTSQKAVSSIRGFLSKSVRIKDFQVVCPTAGTGRLTKGFIKNALMYDRHPAPGVIQMEYQNLDVGSLGSRVLIFENPPFSQHDAVTFFNTMAAWDNVKYIAIVFPDRFRSDQISSNGKEVMHENFHCISHMPIPYGSFDDAGSSKVYIQSSFQIWKRMSKKRTKLDIGVDVGKFHISPNIGTKFWVKIGLDPNVKRSKKTRHRRIVTRTKPDKKYGKSIPICSRRGNIDENFLKEVLRHCYTSYKHHTPNTFHAGNFANALGEMLV